MSENKAFTSATECAAYAMAGNATLTLSSLKTGARYTYRVKRADAKPGDRYPAPWFVGLLTGPDNEQDYAYLGMVGTNGFRLTGKSKHALNSPTVLAFIYFYEKVVRAGTLPDSLEVRHCGTCGRCGRTLTVPASIDRGIGPECAGMLGGALPAGYGADLPAQRPVPKRFRGKRAAAQKAADALPTKALADEFLAKRGYVAGLTHAPGGVETGLNDPLPW